MDDGAIPMEPAPSSGGSNAFQMLRRRLDGDGLFDQQLAYYIGQIALIIALAAAGFTCLFLFHSWLVQLLVAAYLAAVLGQLGLLVHDIGHQQVFRSRRPTELSGLLLGCLGLGWSWSWWLNDHGEHHRYTNRPGRDPSTRRTLAAFTEADALQTRRFVRLVVKHQAAAEFPMYVFVPLLFFIESVTFLVRGKAKHALAESLLLLAHYVLLLALLISQFTPWQAIVFVLVHHGLLGLYGGSIVAPNHKGMPLLPDDTDLDFLHRQVLTARNVSGSRFVDICYGGLNFQIEHHLFPTLPRNRLRKAQVEVKAFCEELSIPYCETSVIQSYREIFAFLSRVSAPLRDRSTVPAAPTTPESVEV
jgi:fatty acid desaturase